IRPCLPWCHFRLWLDTNRRRCAPCSEVAVAGSSSTSSGFLFALLLGLGSSLENSIRSKGWREVLGSIAQRVIGRRGHKPGHRADKILISTGWAGTAGTGGQQVHHKKHSNMISTFPA